jgi:hypothetical protein
MYGHMHFDKERRTWAQKWQKQQQSRARRIKISRRRMSRMSRMRVGRFERLGWAKRRRRIPDGYIQAAICFEMAGSLGRTHDLLEKLRERRCHLYLILHRAWAFL